VLDTYTGAPYRDYQASLSFDDAQLNPVDGLPADWADAPVSNVSGGNVAPLPGGELCGPSPTTQSHAPLLGPDSLTLFCGSLDGTTTAYTGRMAEVVFRCDSAGTATISFVSGSTVLMHGPSVVTIPPDHTHSASVTCALPAVPAASWSIDVVPGGPRTVARVVPVGTSFTVSVHMDAYFGGPWSQYAVVLDYDDVELDVTGLPTDWSNPPAANVVGGNQAVFPNGESCTPTPGSAASSGEDDAGLAAVSVACTDSASATTTYKGRMLDVVFTCEAPGSASINLRGPNDTYVLDGAVKRNDEQHGALITCSSIAQPFASFTVDAVPGGFVDNARTVAVGSTFSVQISAEYVGPSWIAYQVFLGYSDVTLDAVPFGSWNLPPVENVSGGNLYPFVSGPTCDPSSGAASIFGENDAGTAEVGMTCAHASTANQADGGGELVQMVFRCETVGLASLTLLDDEDTFILDRNFDSHNNEQDNATINCVVPLPTSTPTNTPTPTPTLAPSIEKAPEGDGDNVGSDGSLPLANLFLCEDTDGDGPICSGPNEGELTFTERAFATDALGAFEFQIKFDHKIFDINLECVTEQDPGPACTGDADEDFILNTDGDTWDIQLSQQLQDDSDRAWGMDQCFRNLTENYINFACVSVGPQGAGPSGSVDLADVTVHPDADLKFRLTPGNDNGVVRVLLDENCELVDTLGHPLPGSVAGGLTPTCGDLAITIRILEGDLDLDCDVDLGDAQEMAQRYGMVIGLFLYDPWYDLEPNIKDFDIDAKDLQKVFGRIGSSCQEPIPPQPPLAPPQI
jgi:hypothetical protein